VTVRTKRIAVIWICEEGNDFNAHPIVTKFGGFSLNIRITYIITWLKINYSISEIVPHCEPEM
jgi:hypothetical protein